jgi:predicted Zn-dependent protease
MVRLAHDRCLILTLKDQFPGVEKDFKALLQSQPNNWMVNLVRGDMYFKLRRLKDAEVDYLLVIQKGIGTLPDWAIAEARCKAEQIRQTPLKARLEITCEPPASLVNGK